MSSLRTPLSQAKGSGSAKEGTGHFWYQRLTALALLPLVIWFCFSLASLPSMDFLSITHWLQSPFNAILMISALGAMFFHASLGLQMVVEDYISTPGVKLTLVILIKLLCTLFAVTGIFSVAKIALGS